MSTVTRPTRRQALQVLAAIAAAVPAVARAATPPPAPACLPPATAVLAVGDSLTRDSTSYAHLLAEQFSWSLDQQAINGSTLAGQALTWLGAPPGPTLTLAGYNDMRRLGGHPNTVAAWEGLLRGLCHHRTSRGHPVYLGLCLRMTEEGYTQYNPESSYGSDQVVAAYHAATRRVAAAVPGVVVVDTTSYDPYEFTGPDTVHPTAEGQRYLAGLFQGAINPACALALPALYR